METQTLQYNFQKKKKKKKFFFLKDYDGYHLFCEIVDQAKESPLSNRNH